MTIASQLWSDRAYLGNVMGNLESWLLLRSLRTLHLRVPRQSETATALAKWLAAAAGADKVVDGIPAGVISKVWHSSLQGKDKRGFDPAKQMEGGWNATFSMRVSGHEMFVTVTSKLIERRREDGERGTCNISASFSQILRGKFLPPPFIHFEFT